MKRSILFLFLVLSGIAANAQSTTYDLNTSDEDFFREDSIQNEEIENLNLFGANPTLSQKSLKAYLPKQLNLMDGKTPPSAATIWAFTYQAMSIQYWLQYNQPLVFSYSYIHNIMARGNHCQFNATSINKLTTLLNTIGTVQYEKYSFVPTCNPPSETSIKASHFKVAGVGHLFDSFCEDESINCVQSRNIDNKISRIKHAIVQNKPVITQLRVQHNFFSLKSEYIEYNRTETLPQIYKTIVIIGYNDKKQSFEVTFPAGSNWGKDGIAYLRYHDLIYASKAFVLSLDAKPVVAKNELKKQSTPTKIQVKPSQKQDAKTEHKQKSTQANTNTRTVKKEKPASELQVVVTQAPISTITASVSIKNVVLNAELQLITQPLRIIKNGNVLTLEESLSASQRYQLYVSGLNNDSYFYVLNIEEDQKQVHFPVNKTVTGAKTLKAPPLSSFVLSHDTEFFVPQPRIDAGSGTIIPRGFVKDAPQKEYMVLLFSKYKIDDEIRRLLASLTYTPDSEVFHSNLKKVLGERLAQPNKVSQNENGYQLQAESTSGTILPTVIIITGK
ncbi:hypothetical protein [Emticicia sp. W12TSBA100-4]|uniref:hypothetical protein n=1 Tax=Emticicia sp. W12TSBA100-4 TaxID=3160965 RepID=UPI003305D5AF